MTITAPSRRVTQPSRPPALIAADGSRCELAEDGVTMLLRAPDGSLRVRFRGDHCEIVAPRDLTLSAPRGAVRIEAAEGVDVRSERGAVALEGTAVRLADRAGGSLALEDDELDVCASETRLEGDDLDVRLRARAQLVAARAYTVVESVQRVAQTVESHAGRWIERLGESFREVRGLSHERAGRLRLEADDALHLRGARVNVRAEREVDIDGERIQLG